MGRKFLATMPAWVNGKDHKLANRLLEQYPFHQLRSMMSDYFEDVTKGVYRYASFGHFSKCIDELIRKRGPMGFPKERTAAEVDADEETTLVVQIADIRKDLAKNIAGDYPLAVTDNLQELAELAKRARSARDKVRADRTIKTKERARRLAALQTRAE